MKRLCLLVVLTLIGSALVQAQSAYSLRTDFNTNGDFENWTVVEEAQISSKEVSDGVLKVVTAGNDPKMRLANLDIPWENVELVKYRVRQKDTPDATEWRSSLSTGMGFGMSGHAIEGAYGWLSTNYHTVQQESDGWFIVEIDMVSAITDKGWTAPPGDDGDGNWDSIRLDPFGNEGNGYFEVDYVYVCYTDVQEARNPFPADNATDVALSLTLQCDAGMDPNDPEQRNPNVTSHYVYFAAYDLATAPVEPNWLNFTPIAIPDDGSNPVNLIPVTMTRDAKVFWRVDESINGSSATDPNTVPGATWSYETEKSIPVLISSPANQVLDSGQTAVYSTVFTSYNTPTATWYCQSTLGPVNTADGDVTVSLVYDEVTGQYTSTLEIANADTADQDLYNCVIDLQDNPMDESIQSDNALLIVKRLLSHYAFDGDATDSAGSFDGVEKVLNDPNGTVSYATGQIDQAIQLDGQGYVELPMGAYPNNEVGGGLTHGTITFWTQINNVGAFFANYREGTPATNIDLRMSNSGQQIRFYMSPTQEWAINLYSPESADLNIMNDGKMHMVTATYAAGGQAILYLDGIALGTGDMIDDPEFEAFTLPHILGGVNHEVGVHGMMNGLLDDVRFYNYQLSETEVVDLYYQACGKGVCIYPDKVNAEMDFNEDCQVNITDFAMFVASWLDCGIYPNCLN